MKTKQIQQLANNLKEQVFPNSHILGCDCLGCVIPEQFYNDVVKLITTAKQKEKKQNWDFEDRRG